ncbi:amino acid adenylation domain-containing protein [Streptomyces sp. 150FB]|uniref:non-ribosomal peptide synthetase n=1 Tax=Streptomyces sp. 150FB TaxID=1576605 RepID=UPI0006965E06|nr:amino acid adenylation domain-containing protein [Streptomyces sp. 150FB]
MVTPPAYTRDRDLPLHELFDRQALRTPGAVAARHHGRALSYRELHDRSDALAVRLTECDVSTGTNVGVCGRRSFEALVAFLGVLKAGGAYVPLDDELPPARLQAMAEDAEVRTVVVLPGSTCRVRGIRARVELAADGTQPPVRVRTPAPARPPKPGPADCAYVMFTSGSSGRPKPVMIPHRGVVRLALSGPHPTAPLPDDVVLHAYALSSDASTIEIWSALLNGACLELLDREDLLSAEGLERRIREGGVSVAYLTTSVFHHVARSGPEALAGLRFVSAGGEAMDAGLARQVLRACPGTTVVNFYGPTENSVVSTFHQVTAADCDTGRVPIGRPFGASTCYVLRPDGSEAPPGEEGELVVGGDGLGLGYLGDRDLTARRFAESPGAVGERVYRTGDRVVRNDDGALEYLGRLDRQVKLRGHRVEPDEVEALLRSHPRVGEAVVELDTAAEALVAWVTPLRPSALPSPDELRQYCAQWLPPQAVPRLIVQEHLPVTAAGKVDRHALLRTAPGHSAAPPLPRAGETADATGVRGLEDALAEIWHTVLRVRPAGTDSFFALGGDSLLAAEAVTRTVGVLGLEAEHSSRLIRALLATPTLDAFAHAVRTVRHAPSGERTTSESYFVQQAELGFALPPAAGAAPCPGRPRHVLLTGASGFIGAFLLAELLRETDAVVHCPVRARSPEHARRRVHAAFDRFGLVMARAEDARVRCFPYDLTAAGLGLDPAHASELGDRLDLVLHSAAHVNFLYPYEALRAANVEGTREIIRLAAPRRVPVHFLSTVAVLAGFGTAGVRAIGENEPLDHAEGLTMGYAESKWVAEQLLRNAGSEGLPVSIYRPYEVTGDRRSGACNTETAICSLFKTIAETGLAPGIPLPMDFVPVDHLAAAVVRIATRQPADNRTYHLTNPAPALLDDVLDRMRAAGFHLRTLPYGPWVRELVRHVVAHPTSATAPFVSLCVDRSNKADISVKEMYLQGTFPALGRDNTERALAGGGLECPPVDDQLLDRYLEYFFTSGFISRPSLGAGCPTPVAGPRDGSSSIVRSAT